MRDTLMRDTVTTLVHLRLVYLARLREAFSSAGESFELAAHDRPTVADVVDALRARGGAWAAELAPGRAVRFAVNHRLARADQPVADNDEVAILPPVTGG
jgi:molybdopterin synthase sulfur carrier subunit